MTTATKDTFLEPYVRDALIAEGNGPLAGILESLQRNPTRQQWPILRSGKRTNLVCGGPRGGKSDVATKFLWSHKNWGSPQLFWLGAASYELTKPEFDYLAEEARKLGILAPGSKNPTPRVDPGHMELIDGTIIETKSATNPRTWAGQSVDGIILCEAAQVDIDLYYRSVERLAEARGWLLMVGTLEGSLGWYPKLYELWRGGLEDAQSFSLPTWSNTYLFPGGRTDPEILRLERELPEDIFRERMAGEPVPPSGLVFKEFRPDVHIRKCQYDPNLPLYMWVDPGHRRACAYLFAQEVDGQIRVFHEIFDIAQTADDIIDKLTSPRYPMHSINEGFWERANRADGPGIVATEDAYGDQHHHMSSIAEQWRKRTGLILRSNKIRSVNDVDELIHYWLLV